MKKATLFILGICLSFCSSPVLKDITYPVPTLVVYLSGLSGKTQTALNLPPYSYGFFLGIR